MVKIEINIEKKHIYLLAFLFSFLGIFIVIGAAPFDTNLGWHPLQQIATDETGTASVDANSNAVIDKAENISLTDGKASVGNDTTDSTLEIRGKTTGYSSVDFYSGSTNEWGIGKNTAGDFYIDESGIANRFTILAGGNVGIGVEDPNTKLAVLGRGLFSGEVQIGSTELDCESDVYGTIKYDQDSNCLQLCTDPDWQNVSCAAPATPPPPPLQTVYYPAPNDPSSSTTIEPTWGGWSDALNGWNTEELSYSNGVYSFGRNNVPNPSTIDITYASFIYTGDSDTKGIMKTAADKMLDMDTGWDTLPWAKLQFYQDDNVVWEANTNNGIGIYRGRGWKIPSTPIDLSAAGVDFSGTHTYYFRYSTGNAKWWKTNFYLEFEN